jgi:hypothetical protein
MQGNTDIVIGFITILTIYLFLKWKLNASGLYKIANNAMESMHAPACSTVFHSCSILDSFPFNY